MTGDEPVDVVRDADEQESERQEVIGGHLDGVSEQLRRAQLADAVELIDDHEQREAPGEQVQRAHSGVGTDVPHQQVFDLVRDGHEGRLLYLGAGIDLADKPGDELLPGGGEVVVDAALHPDDKRAWRGLEERLLGHVGE